MVNSSSGVEENYTPKCLPLFGLILGENAVRYGIICPVKTTTTAAPHIGLNAQLLSLQQTYRGAGISWYIFNLLKHLPEVQDTFRLTAFHSDAEFQPPHGLAARRGEWGGKHPIARIAWEQTVLPVLLRQYQVDLLHALAFVSPLANRLPTVLTIYDLSFVRYPQLFRPFNRWYLSTLTRVSAHRADAVIAISDSTRRDVISAFGVPEQRVQTVYCGADDVFCPLSAAQIAAFRAEKNLPEHFIFRLGTLEPRKNVEGVIRAYAAWRQRDTAAPPLIVGGGKGWYYEQVFRLVETLGLTEHVYFPGYLSQNELPLWYNAATMFVYPSYFEGFGLPVLEAMACGTPVITSNVSSLPEVAGEAAIFVSPDDIDGLSIAMQHIITDAALAQSLKEKGLQQAAQFNWAKTAIETASIYRQVLEKA